MRGGEPRQKLRNTSITLKTKPYEQVFLRVFPFSLPAGLDKGALKPYDSTTNDKRVRLRVPLVGINCFCVSHEAPHVMVVVRITVTAKTAHAPS